jgi:hypothetical protein
VTLPVCRGTVPGPGPDHCAEDANRNFDPVAGAVTYPGRTLGRRRHGADSA